MNSVFISFEGGEGAGKSTQIERLATHLRAADKTVCVTREPGGTTGAEAIRALLVSGDTPWSAHAETLLNYAARDDHLRRVIRPALAQGDWVLCDRFMDSTSAYQVYAGGCDPAFVSAVGTAIVGHTRPQLTLLLDLPPEDGLARAYARGGGREDRYEARGLAYHQKVRDGFLALAHAEPERFRIINALGPVEAIAQTIWHEVQPWL